MAEASRPPTEGLPGRRSRAWRLITYNGETKFGFAIVGAFLLVSVVEAIGGYAILPYNPLKTFVGPALAPPSISHPFGTTDLGMDLFSRIIAGAPNDAMVSIVVVAVGLTVGSLFGSFAGYKRGVLDGVLMRITDVFFTFPALILGLVVTVVLGVSPINVMLALSVIWWPQYARVSRGEALRLSGSNFVEAARISGVPSYKIVVRHILAVSLPVLLVYATLDVGTVVFTYAGLSYLGLAVRPPQPDWGSMIAQYQDYLIAAPWLSLIPAAIIMMIAAGFSLLGDGLRAALQAERGR
jgi:ABC-type dipeptide/oligopeptide/nickel transport system permease subunit